MEPGQPGLPSDRANLSLEADGLVVARGRAHVAERQAVFDESGTSASLTATQSDYVFADGAVKRFRVHAIASDRHPVTR